LQIIELVTKLLKFTEISGFIGVNEMVDFFSKTWTVDKRCGFDEICCSLRHV